jgi:hypothetical protein
VHEDDIDGTKVIKGNSIRCKFRCSNPLLGSNSASATDVDVVGEYFTEAAVTAVKPGMNE